MLDVQQHEYLSKSCKLLVWILKDNYSMCSLEKKYVPSYLAEIQSICNKPMNRSSKVLQHWTTAPGNAHSQVAQQFYNVALCQIWVISITAWAHIVEVQFVTVQVCFILVVVVQKCCAKTSFNYLPPPFMIKWNTVLALKEIFHRKTRMWPCCTFFCIIPRQTRSFIPSHLCQVIGSKQSVT